MKSKPLAIAIAMLVALGGAPAVAHAQTLKASASINKAGAKGALGVVFTESGLSSGQAVSYAITVAYVSATYSCNGVAQAPVGGPEEVDVSLTASSKGTVRNTVAVMRPSSPCAIGDTSKLTNVSYTNVTVTDVTDGASVALGDYSASF
jgi:hypothetical protein